MILKPLIQLLATLAFITPVIAEEQNSTVSRADLYRLHLMTNSHPTGAYESPTLGNLNLEFKSLVKTTLETFIFGILDRVDNQPFSVHQYLGFSGAGFKDSTAFEKDFTRSVIQKVKFTQKTLGPKGLTVIILGGTRDGFGKGYEIIENLKAKKLISRTVVVGMVSDVAVDYHLEGHKNEWGDVISPLQEMVFLKETYTDESGSRSWELKSSPVGESDTAKVLKDLAAYENTMGLTLNVFGGGVQAFNETLEFILEARGKSTSGTIHLHVGYEPGKPKKDTGYRASDMIALLLLSHPYLTPSHLKVSVNIGAKSMSLEAFKETMHFKKLKSDLRRAEASSKVLKEIGDIQDDLAAQLRYFEALLQIDSLAVLEINKFRERSSQNLSALRDTIKKRELLTTNPTYFRSAFTQVDSCQQCARDAESLLKKISCQRLLR